MALNHIDGLTMTIIKTHLNEIMEARGLTNADVHYGARVSLQTVARWRSGTLGSLKPDTVNKLKQFLGVRDSDLYTIDEEPIESNDDD